MSKWVQCDILMLSMMGRRAKFEFWHKPQRSLAWLASDSCVCVVSFPTVVLVAVVFYASFFLAVSNLRGVQLPWSFGLWLFFATAIMKAICFLCLPCVTHCFHSCMNKFINKFISACSFDLVASRPPTEMPVMSHTIWNQMKYSESKSHVCAVSCCLLRKSKTARH